jgi:glycosyltransferase involved in cell wall biosynthesis
MSELPSVEVLIPTRDRPELLALAIAAVRRQAYGGPLSIAVIFDQQEPDLNLADDAEVPIRVISNYRTPGLSGARNSGILSSAAEFVAFCDDDDQWLPGKLYLQIERMLADSDEDFVTTSIRVDFEDHRSVRLAGLTEVTHARLLDSRMSMLHSSTFLFRRVGLIERIGLVNEDAPGGQNEDWELLLRASALRPIAHVDQALVAVRWGSTSMFSRSWESKIKAAEWMIERFPAIRDTRVGYARLMGQIAFANAALGHRREALRCAVVAARTRPQEPRAYVAAAVALRLATASFALGALHRYGRGI